MNTSGNQYIHCLRHTYTYKQTHTICSKRCYNNWLRVAQPCVLCGQWIHSGGWTIAYTVTFGEHLTHTVKTVCDIPTEVIRNWQTDTCLVRAPFCSLHHVSYILKLKTSYWKQFMSATRFNTQDTSNWRWLHLNNSSVDRACQSFKLGVVSSNTTLKYISPIPLFFFFGVVWPAKHSRMPGMRS